MGRPPENSRQQTTIESPSEGTRDPAPRVELTPAHRQGAKCAECSLRSFCLPSDLPASTHASLGAAISSRRRYTRDETLYGIGDKLEAVYAIRAGFFKTSVVSEDGREQVTGFHMEGDIVGIEGIGGGHHTSRAVALDESEVCVIPLANLMQLGLESQPIQHHLHRMLSREISRDQSVMAMLGGLSAEERLATFLINLSRRLQARNYSPSDFRLPMTREDLGSYLGLKLETVSRTLTKLHGHGLIDVQRRHIQIRRLDALAELVGR